MATGKSSGTAPGASKGAKPGGPKAKGDPSRTARVSALRDAERRRERRQVAIISLIGVVSVALIAGLVFFFYANRPKPLDYSKVPNAAPLGVNDTYNMNAKDSSGARDRWGGIQHNHVEGTITYTLSPPDGGDHNQYPQTCGVYNHAVANENAVHSLEHGAVWITYKPGISATQLATIKADVHALSYTLVSPYPSLTSNVVASAWGVQLKLDSAKDPRLQQFIKYYRLNSIRTPEVGVACAGVN